MNVDTIQAVTRIFQPGICCAVVLQVQVPTFSSTDLAFDIKNPKSVCCVSRSSSHIPRQSSTFPNVIASGFGDGGR
jgi:hypothetical protein